MNVALSRSSRVLGFPPPPPAATAAADDGPLDVASFTGAWCAPMAAEMRCQLLSTATGFFRFFVALDMCRLCLGSATLHTRVREPPRYFRCLLWKWRRSRGPQR